MSLLDLIKKSEKPFVIAEIGVNYYDISKQRNITLMEAAKLMIDEAKKGKVDAVKFQTYKAEKLAVVKSPAFWDLNDDPVETQFEEYKNTDKFNEKDYIELAEYCKSNDILFMSTSFDFESADYLDELMPAYKIASADITNIPFIKYIAGKRKPVFLSVGASTIGETDEAINVIRGTGNEEIVIMHCVLSYPTKFQDVNLNFIKYLKSLYPDYLIGYSDHAFADENMIVLTTAYQYGAKIIEKHFTLDKTIVGNDHCHAAGPDDFMRFANNIDLLEKINGQYKKEVLECEKLAGLYARRSIVASDGMQKGTIITNDKIAFKRPGTGISPRDVDKVLGMKLEKSVEADEVIEWTDLKISQD